MQPTVDSTATVFAAHPSPSAVKPPEAPSQRLSLVALMLWAAGGLASGLLAQTMVRDGWPALQAALHQSARPVQRPGAEWLAATQPGGSALPAQAPVRPAAAPPPHAMPANLQAELVVDDVPVPLNQGRLVLPTGTRFHVQLRSDQAGRVRIHTIGPGGAASRQLLWHGSIRAGQALQSPGLRLDGAQGLETLQIVLLDAQGRAVGHRQLQFWHL